jgi:guanosine-3',5'-bis(diphosphate) 3'-pyrophosphohydrolase
MYDEIVRLVAERAAAARDSYLRQVIDQVQSDLKSAKIKATVTGRPKHYYSIYQKMIVRGRDFDDIYDLVGMRILVDTVRDCYAALGVIHARWKPVPGRFKDYIAMPKFNMYQSLHTTVIGPTGKPVELQIRTFAMHRTRRVRHRRALEVQGARKGATIVGKAAGAHRRDGLAAAAARLAARDRATRASSSSRCASTCPATPRSTSSPRRATSSRCRPGLDPGRLRLRVHTEVGHNCIGARVNGKLVPLESTLDNGDVVEIFTSKAPRRPVAGLARLRQEPRARNKIRQWFPRSAARRRSSGKDAIAKAMRKQGLPLQRC